MMYQYNFQVCIGYLMNLNFSDEQNLLREQIQKFCNSDYDFYDRENFAKSESGYDSEKWKLFAEQGWLAMPFSSESGGFDFGPIRRQPCKLPVAIATHT